MHRRIALSLAIAMLSIAADAEAEVTLDQCQSLAAQNYPVMRQYDLLHLSESLSLEAIDKDWLPQISVGAQATWQTEVPTMPSTLTSLMTAQGLSLPGMNKDQYKLSVELYQPLWDGGKSRADRRRARAESSASAAATDVEMYAVRERVNNLYFGVLLLREQSRQLLLTTELLDANIARLRSMVSNGAAMQSDADQVEAEALAVGQRRVQTDATADAYCRMLSLFTGTSIDKEELTPPTLPQQPQQADIRRPELQAFSARSAAIAAQESSIKASLMPRIGFFAQGYVGYPGFNYFESMLNDRWSWNALLGLKLSWNIGSLYTRSNSLRQLRASQQSVAIERDVFLFNTRLNIEEENAEIRRLRAVLADDSRIVALRRSVRIAAESQLNNGVIDATALLQKITDEMQASIARASHEIELAKTIYQLRHTLNQ